MKLTKILFLLFFPFVLLASDYSMQDKIWDKLQQVEKRVEFLEERDSVNDLMNDWVLFSMNDMRIKSNLPSYDWTDFKNDYKDKFGRDPLMPDPKIFNFRGLD